MSSQPLVIYIAAILGRASPVHIREVERSTTTWPEEGFSVLQEVAIYRFSDGARLRRTTEQDSLPAEVEACPECWITYEVLDSAPAISPARIRFNSSCREAFWLRYHDRNGTDEGG
jgi:hypothetical protein